MQAPKETIQNKYLQHPTTILWTCSTAAAVVVGHENGNNLYKFFNYSSLFAFVRKLCLTMFMFMFLGLSFLHVWCLKLFFFFADRSLAACQRKIFSMNLSKGPPQAPLLSIWIVAQRTLLPPSWKQSKNQTLRICIWFWRIFHLFICFNVFIFHFYILPFFQKTICFYFLENNDY